VHFQTPRKALRKRLKPVIILISWTHPYQQRLAKPKPKSRDHFKALISPVTRFEISGLLKRLKTCIIERFISKKHKNKNQKNGKKTA
jgi:hypothetical protein